MPTPNRPYYPKQKLLLPPDLLPLARPRRAPEASKVSPAAPFRNVRRFRISFAPITSGASIQDHGGLPSQSRCTSIGKTKMRLHSLESTGVRFQP